MSPATLFLVGIAAQIILIALGLLLKAAKSDERDSGQRTPVRPAKRKLIQHLSELEPQTRECGNERVGVTIGQQYSPAQAAARLKQRGLCEAPAGYYDTDPLEVMSDPNVQLWMSSEPDLWQEI